MRLLELLREYADACEARENAAEVRKHLIEHGYSAAVDVSMDMVEEAGRRIAQAEAAFEKEMNDLVDRRVQKALDDERQKAGEGW